MRRFALPALIALLATAPLAAPASADTPADSDTGNGAARPLALGEALQVAVRQNPSLLRATIDMKIADAAALAALGLDDWLVTGTGSWSSTRTQPVTGNPFQRTGANTYTLAAGLSRALSTGGTLSFDLSGLRNDEDFVVELDPMNGQPITRLDQSSTSYIGGISAKFFQPLLRDRGERIARAAQRKAAIARSSAVLGREATALDTVRQIIEAYWEVAYAAREAEIRNVSLDLALEQLRITRAGIDAGATAPTESLALEQGIAVREEAILLAEIAVSERSLELRRLVGLEVGPGEIDISAVEPESIDDRDFDLDATIARALERNPNLGLLARTDETNRIDVELTENGLRPRLDVTASAGPSGSSDTLRDTARQIYQFESYGVSASLRYEHTLGNRAARGARKSAAETVLRTRIDLEEGRRETAVSVVRAIDLVRTARKRIEVTDKSIKLAEQNLATEKARFEAGDATNFDILRRQEEIEQARLSHERAIVDHLKAIALVDSLTGDLLDRYGIRIDEGSDS